MDTGWCAPESCLVLGTIQCHLAAHVIADITQLCHIAGQRRGSVQIQGSLTEEIFFHSVSLCRHLGERLLIMALHLSQQLGQELKILDQDLYVCLHCLGFVGLFCNL